MGFYSERIVPRVVDLVLGTKDFGRLRRRVCAGLAGDVVEIGFGSGLNLPHLPSEVTGVWAVDPSGTAMKIAARRIAASAVPVHAAGLDGERLDLPDARFDAALSTMTLCTIPDAARALAEIRRVLRPGAPLHFAEHGLAPDPKVVRSQHRFTPVQRRLAAGCHLDRDIDALIEGAGLELETLDTFYLQGAPKPMGAMYVGRATKPRSE